MSETTPIITTDNETVSQPVIEKEPALVPPTRKKTSPKRPSAMGAILCLMLILAGALVSYFFWQKLERQQQDLSLQQESYNALERRLQVLLTDQQQQQADAAKQIALVNDEQQRLAERVLELEPKDAEFWRIKEASELVTQAEQRLVLTADGDAALRLLKRADALLSKELHSSVLPLREQLLEGITALENFVGQDFTGHWLKLKKWEKQSQTLPLRNREKHVAIPEGEQAEHWWQRVVSHLPVKVRKPQAELDIPLTEQTELLAKTLLVSALQEARLGLLQQQSEIYNSGLVSAEQILQQYYRTDTHAVQEALVTLDELAALSVMVNPPQLIDLVTLFRRAAAEGGA